MDAKDYLGFAITKETRYLFKIFLESLEEIRRQHDSSLYKLLTALPPAYQGQVVQASFFDQEAYQHFRKIVLDHGNNSVRSILDELEKYEIDFKRGAAYNNQTDSQNQSQTNSKKLDQIYP